MRETVRQRARRLFRTTPQIAESVWFVSAQIAPARQDSRLAAGCESAAGVTEIHYGSAPTARVLCVRRLAPYLTLQP